MKYTQTDDNGEATGREITLSDVELSPLDYKTLSSHSLGREITIPLKWTGARVTESTIPDIKVGQSISGTATAQSHLKSKSIGLVKGGWLPSGLALEADMIVLPDRCTVSELKGRFREGAKRRNDSSPDFIDLFAQHPLAINPILFALEGNAREAPTPERMEAQWEEGCAAILGALPNAKIVPEGIEGIQGVLGIARDTLSDMARKQDFLMRLAPLLHAPVSASQKSARCMDVLAMADVCNLPRHSIVVLAALSAVVVPNGRSPAKRLLKWKERYTFADAYNALADLRSLELLMSIFAVFPDQRLMLCTGDKDLALFWTGIEASDFYHTKEGIHFRISLSEDLFPGLTDADRLIIESSQAQVHA